MRRVFFVDDNICSADGHFFEIAMLLRQGAQKLGYRSELATGFHFQPETGKASDFEAVFTATRMFRWSLGVDGHSRVARDVSGKPSFGTLTKNIGQSFIDLCHRTKLRPKSMLQTWATELADWLRGHQVTPDDTLVVNTGDDFQLLALSASLEHLGTHAPREVHIVFHFGIFDTTSGIENPDHQALQMGAQINRTLAMMKKQQVHLYTTTKPLESQLRAIGVKAKTIPYPIRRRINVGCDPIQQKRKQPKDPCSAGNPQHHSKLNLVFGGWPRREKGVRSIAGLLKNIYPTHIQNGPFRVSMQLPAKKWKRIVPKEFHDVCRLRPLPLNENEEKEPMPLVDLITSSISTTEYQRWLDNANVGVFLYDPNRYVARCSAVLLELMARGVPVVVPNNCWLADQVNQANETRTIGYVYHTIDEVPRLLTQIAEQYQTLRDAALQHGRLVADRHDPVSTLQAMGL